jgi:hypothetical protein
MYLLVVRWITGTDRYHMIAYNDLLLVTELGNLVTKNYLHIDIYKMENNVFIHKLRMDHKQ